MNYAFLRRMKFDIITIGGATEDVALNTKDGVLLDNKNDLLRQKLLAFEYGAKVDIEKAFFSFGGGAANVAVSSSLLGLKTAIIAAVGDDNPAKSIVNNLKDKGVDVSLVKEIKGMSSGLSFLLVGEDNEHIVFSARGANSYLEISEKDLKNLRKTEWIFISSLSGKWQDCLEKIFSLEAKIAWNPGHVQLKKGISGIGKYLKNTKVLILNKDEATELVLSHKNYKDRDGDFFNDINNILSALKSFGPEIAVVTNGHSGAHAHDGKEFYFQPAIKEKRRVDTTGVGDAFGSSFVAGLKIYQGDIRKAMFLGARNTSSVVSIQGAQNGLLTKKDL